IEKKIKSIGGFDCIISKTCFFENHVDNILSCEKRTKLTNTLMDDFLTLKISWYTSDPMWKKSFLVDKVLFNEDLLKGQDRDFHIRMLLNHPKIKILDDYLYLYRRNSHGITKT